MKACGFVHRLWNSVLRSWAHTCYAMRYVSCGAKVQLFLLVNAYLVYPRRSGRAIRRMVETFCPREYGSCRLSFLRRLPALFYQLSTVIKSLVELYLSLRDLSSALKFPVLQVACPPFRFE